MSTLCILQEDVFVAVYIKNTSFYTRIRADLASTVVVVVDGIES